MGAWLSRVLHRVYHDPSLARRIWFCLFCEERCGCDAAGDVLVSEAALDEMTKLFGPAVTVSLARLAGLAESDWFVSEKLFRRTAQAETARLNSYGYGVECELFGVCFDSGGFALLQHGNGAGAQKRCGVRAGCVAVPIRGEDVCQRCRARACQAQGRMWSA